MYQRRLLVATSPRLMALAALALVASLAGCTIGPDITGSGTVVQTSPDVEPFDSLVVGSAFDVTMRFGEEPSLVLRTDDNLVEHIDVSSADDTLSIALDRSVGDATLQADLTVPAAALASIEVIGASSLTATDPITSAQLRMRTGGASRAFVVVTGDTFDVTADGASVVNAGGSVTSLSVDARGASTLQLSELAAQSVEVTADGASRVDVTASGELLVRAGGASTVRYSGSPRSVEREVSGASTVEPA